MLEGKKTLTPRGRVLIADDDELQRHLFQRLCVREGFVCDSAANGVEALGLADHHDYKLMFVDLYMPGSSFETLLPQLQQKQTDAEIVVISVEDDEHTLQDVFDRGIAAFLRKPIDPDVLSRVLERCMEPCN